MSTQTNAGKGASHASDSALPQGIQDRVRLFYTFLEYHFANIVKVSKGTENKVPDALHDTGSNKHTGNVSHATGDSKVPQTLQEGLPEKVEKIVPNAIHDTSGAKFSDGSRDTSS
jgi:hypothetical protein